MASVGLEMAVATVLGWGIGTWLDNRFDTGPWLMLLFLLLGIADRAGPVGQAGQGATAVNPEALARIERLNYLLATVAVAIAALLFARADLVGVTMGAAIGCANFTMIRRLVGRWMRSAADQRNTTALLFLPKMMVLIAVVFVVIRYVPMNPVAFAIGFSVFLVSIAVETVRFALFGAGTIAAR
jgi:hypothetical protein